MINITVESIVIVRTKKKVSILKYVYEYVINICTSMQCMFWKETTFTVKCVL